MKYFIGILIVGAGGFLIGFIWNKLQKKETPSSIKVNVSSYLVRIGELRVYRAYMKEIVTSVDHVWGDIGKKYFSWMLSEKKLAMVFEFEVDFVYNLLSEDFKVIENSKSISITMPKCKYDVKIKDFYFYDEQGTRLKILPEFLSSIFDGGVSDLIGRQIRELVNYVHYPGMNTIQWDAKNDKGDPVSSSLYLYTIEAEDFVDTKKMILLK